jgi:hypothetical protein
MYLLLVLTILFTHTSCARNPIILYPCCMVVRQFGYLTRPFDYILVKVLHCSLIGWERHTIASQDCLTLAGELIRRQHNRLWLHRRLTLRSPSGTLGMRVATQVPMRVVVTTALTVTSSLASETELPSLSGTLTGTLLWSSTSVMGLTRLSARWKGSDNSSDGWMTLHTCNWRCKPPSSHGPAWCMTSSVTSGVTLMIKSYKDFCLGEVPGAQVWVLPCRVSFLVFLVILWLVSLAVPLLSSRVLVWIASIS